MNKILQWRPARLPFDTSHDFAKLQSHFAIFAKPRADDLLYQTSQRETENNQIRANFLSRFSRFFFYDRNKREKRTSEQPHEGDALSYCRNVSKPREDKTFKMSNS